MASVLIVIAVNGTHGYSTDWTQFAEGLRAQFESRKNSLNGNTQLFLLLSQASQGLETHDGIAVMAERLSVEVNKWVKESVLAELAEGTRIYFTICGHSLGGLICRAAAPILLPLLRSACQNHTLIPMSYLGISTPHLGIRRTLEKSSHWAQRLWGIAIETAASFGVGKTGRELLLLDNAGRDSLSLSFIPRDDVEYPILYEMAREGSHYANAIQQFRRKTLVAALHGDMMVPWSSASVIIQNPDIHGEGFVSVGDAEFRIHSISHFNHDRSACDLTVFGGLTDRPPTELACLADRTFPNLGFYSNSPSDAPDWIPDSVGDLLIPTKLLLAFEKTAHDWRRVNINMALTAGQVLHRAGIHAWMVGKDSFVLPAKVREMVRTSAFFCAKIIVSDFFETAFNT